MSEWKDRHLIKELAELTAKIASLEAELAESEKNSSNSSKPAKLPFKYQATKFGCMVRAHSRERSLTAG